MKQPDLGKKISELRLLKGLTQSELAENCNISLRTIQRIESTYVTPRSYTVKLIFSNLDFDFLNSIESINKLDTSSINNGNWFEQFYINVFDLFNLKTNTMKKATFISVVVALVAIGLFITNHTSNAQSIGNWFKAGNKPGNYKIGFDNSVFRTGKKSAFMESTDKKIDGFGTLMQSCDAKNYLGKRIKMTGFLKSENVVDWSGMWLRIDSKMDKKKSLGFDNMQNRAIKGTTDWTKCEIILDVPNESGTLNYGFLISGTGKIWFDDISFEIFDDLKIETTNTTESKILDKPSNIDFEE